MKYLVLFIVALSVFWACNRNKNINGKTSDSNETNLVNDSTVPLSPSTKLFLQALQNDLGDKILVDYTPSADMIERFNLMEKQGSFYIGGSLKKGESYSAPTCESLGVLLGTDTGPNVSCYVPLSKLENFLTYDGIIYFKIAEKVYPKIKK